MRLTARACSLAIAVILGIAPTAGAQVAADTLRLEEVVKEAREANPMLRAMRLRADAAEERISQAGALPDPVLGFALKNRPLDGFGTSERMTMNSFQLAQRLPWPGKLGYAEERESHLARAADFTAAESEVTLIARAKMVYFQLAYMDRALRIMDDTRDLLREFLGVSSTLYSVGTGLQQDVLQAQVAVASMTESITVLEQGRIAMAARLNALLGREASRPVGALELPTAGGQLLTVDSLMALAANTRPALQAARERTLAAEAAYRAARRQLYPDFAVSLEYGQRPEFDDMVSVMVGISIPVWAGSKQLPLREEMQAREAMEWASELDLYNETYARIAEARAEADRALRLSDLYTTSILPQAKAAVESSLSAYRVGQVDFMTLVQNELTVNRYEIEGVRLAAAYHGAVAEIEALIGAELEKAR